MYDLLSSDVLHVLIAIEGCHIHCEWESTDP
jgi:hypothetical protein